MLFVRGHVLLDMRVAPHFSALHQPADGRVCVIASYLSPASSFSQAINFEGFSSPHSSKKNISNGEIKVNFSKNKLLDSKV